MFLSMLLSLRCDQYNCAKLLVAASPNLRVRNIREWNNNPWWILLD
jgi:hypothetical protein